ncbi:MAG: PadR family transcriptional regulator [Nitrososphaerales archaeon]
MTHAVPELEKFTKPQGAPRGLLLHYIMYKISMKPSHGYEILQDIEEKTAGAWRPGPGSIYPMLKKLVSKGYIKSESPRRVKTSQRIYQITPKGRIHIQKIKKIFTNAGQRWGSLARIFVDMLEPSDLAKFFVDASKNQFGVARESIESKLSLIPRVDAEFMLKEYSLNLQRQLDWSNKILRGFQHTNPIRAETKIASK